MITFKTFTLLVNGLFYWTILKCSIIPIDNFTVDKTNSDVLKVNCDSHNLKEHLEVLNSTDIDVTRGNYSNSTAIKILDDVAKNPVDKNVSYPKINVYFIFEWRIIFIFRVILCVIYVYVNFTTGKIIRNTSWNI